MKSRLLPPQFWTIIKDVRLQLPTSTIICFPFFELFPDLRRNQVPGNPARGHRSSNKWKQRVEHSRFFQHTFDVIVCADSLWQITYCWHVCCHRPRDASTKTIIDWSNKCILWFRIWEIPLVQVSRCTFGYDLSKSRVAIKTPRDSFRSFIRVTVCTESCMPHKAIGYVVAAWMGERVTKGVDSCVDTNVFNVLYWSCSLESF